MKTSLQQIEQLRNKDFSPDEIQELLRIKFEDGGKYENLEVFYRSNQALLEGTYGKENTLEVFRKDLDERLQTIKDFIYFRRLEGNLTTRVEKRLGGISSDSRADITELLGQQNVLDEQLLNTIRDTRPRDILSGEVKLEEETIKAYIELVRAELKRQVLKAEEFTAEEVEAHPEKAQELYEKSSTMLDFILASADLDEASREYLHAYLLRSIRGEDGLQYIQRLYRDLKSALVDDDAEKGRQDLQSMVNKLQENAKEHRADHILEVIKTYAPKIQLSAVELKDLQKQGLSLSPVSYDQKMAVHLSAIEAAVFEIELEEMSGQPRQSNIDRQQQLMRLEVEAMEADVTQFKGEKYTAEYLIDQMSEYVVDDDTKKKLQKSYNFLKHQKGESEDRLKKQIQGLVTPADIDSFLLQAEAKVEEYLCQESEPKFDRAALQTLREKNEHFNIYEVLTNRDRYVHREQPKKKDSKPSAYFEGAELEAIERQISIMEGIIGSRFTGVDADQKFDEAQKELKRLEEKSAYQVAVPKTSQKDPVTAEELIKEHEDIKKGIINYETAYKEMPPEYKVRLDALWAQGQNRLRYRQTREAIEKITDLGNETQLRAGLAALYSEEFKVSPEKAEQLPKLTKIMSLDHPITCIRFNAADQMPFDNHRGFYDLHKLNGQPATYKERAMDLLKMVQQHSRSGDFDQIRKLFERGGKGDRLYMDSLFFPVSAIKNESVEDGIVYDTTVSKETGEKVQTLSNKIPSTHQHIFEAYKDKSTEQYKSHKKKYDEDHDLKKLKTNTLAEDQEFTGAFEEAANNLKLLAIYQDALIFNDDGTIDVDPEKVERIGGETKGIGLEDVEELRISADTLKRIANKSGDHPGYPLIAARAAQFESLGWGFALGGAQYGAREAMALAKLPYQFASTYLTSYWKGVKFFSPMSIYVAIHEFYEHIAQLADFRMKFKAYTILKDTFKGTIIGSEFEKLQQAKENERVDAFKGAFAQYGNTDVLDKLKNPRDRFELKATLIEGFDNRGLFTIEDMLDNDVFKVINRFTPDYVIPVGLYTEDQMKNDPEKKAVMTNHLRMALDNIWGTGTWIGYRTNGINKYEANRKQANETFKTNTSAEKIRTYKEYWEWLKKPRDDNPLLKIPPATLVGNIENDMMDGNRDSGETFTILQALICEGYLRLEHINRLAQTHVNDLAIFTVLEPIQAELSGMSAYIKDALARDLPYETDKNPVMQFYQGKRALEFNAKRDEGKWTLHKDYAGFEKDEKEGKNDKVSLTAHQLQRNREPQPRFLAEMDNSSAGIYTPSYSWQDIENAFRPDARGNFTARAHDCVAIYRGIHEEMLGYMDKMSKPPQMKMTQPEQVLDFKRSIWQAYNAICKTTAFAQYFSQHQSKSEDYNFNLMDASPILEAPHKERRGPEGTTNFEKLIIQNSGRQQRLSESSDHFDSEDMDGVVTEDFRKKFKEMAGYQYVSTLGIDPDGKSKTKNARVDSFDQRKYQPAKQFSGVIESFYENVLMLAEKRGFKAEIQRSLDASKMKAFNTSNADRQRSLNDFVKNEAKLP